MCCWVVLALALLLPAVSRGGGGGGGGDEWSEYPYPMEVEEGIPVVGGPRFAPGQHTAVVAAAGKQATLHCQVLGLGPRTISWIRSRDLQILSHGGAVFTADRRVSTGGSGVAGHAGGEAGGAGELLVIERLRRNDAGRYECQLNTEPKMSLFFNLTVLDALPAVTVTVHGTQHAATGMAASLSCVSLYETSASDDTRAVLRPLEPRWFKDQQEITFQSLEGGVSLETERWAGGARAALRVAHIRRDHAGRYQCRVTDLTGATVEDSIDFAVTDAEDDDGGVLMEAMQRDQSSPGLGAGGGGATLPRAMLVAFCAICTFTALTRRDV